MSRFSLTNQWAEYQAVQFAAAEVSEKYADAEVDRFKALAALDKADKETVTAARARAYQDPAFVEAREAQDKAYTYRKMIEAIYNNTERKANVLSRELTRRIGRNDRESRSNRYV